MNPRARRTVETVMRRLRKPLLGLLVLGLALGASACGDEDEDEDASTETTVAADDGDAAAGGGTEATSAEIRIADFAFSGAQVAPGGTVSISNADDAPHTVTADEGDAFDVRVDGGGTAELTAPDEPGTYAYHCEIHSQMKGELVVE